MTPDRIRILIAGMLLGVCSSIFADPLSEPCFIEAKTGTIELMAIPTPDLAHLEESLQMRLTSARADVAKQIRSGNTEPVALANALGLLGELYHANHIYAPAEPCYRNAGRLDPANYRWPHLLGYLGQQTTQYELAIPAFKQARAANPEYEASRIRLAQTYIELNRHAEAELLLDGLEDDRGIEAAVQFYKGQVALAQRKFKDATAHFEKALVHQPGAIRIHYPLAMAYRGAGDIDRAKEHIARYGDGKIHITDPLVDGLDDLVTGNRTQLHRGLVAVQTGQYDVAIDAFGEALEGDPENVDLRISYARSLYLGGQYAAGRQQLAEAIRRDPNNPLANFLAGVLRAADNEYGKAINHFETAIASEPEHAGARHFLADTLVREGRYDEAVPHYQIAIKEVPRNTPARILEAASLLRSDAPHSEVISRFETLQSEQSGNPVFTYLVARMLAASPDGKIRDGNRALTLAKSLYRQLPVADNAETLAMAHAENGNFQDAIAMQQEAIASAMMSGRFDMLPRLQVELEHYEKHEPWRTPFARNDLFLQPLPVDPIRPFRDYPARNPY